MIRISDLSFCYSGRRAWVLKDVSLRIKRGEFILLAGSSGSGKTTLTKSINGLIPHFEQGMRAGEVFLDGTELADMKMHTIAMKAGSIFQDPRSQFFTTTTTDEIAFGCENMGLDFHALRRRVNQAFNHLSIDHLKERSVFSLSSGEKQKVVFASIHAMGPDVLVLDEPSSNLDPPSICRLFNILTSLKNDGKTIIIAEHRLYYLKSLVDRLILMDDGRVAAEYDKTEIERMTPDQLTNIGLRQFDLKGIIPAGSYCYANNRCSLMVEKLRFKYGSYGSEILKGINFKVSGGEIVAIVGANGTGKTTLAKVLSGVLKESEGTVKINGQPMHANLRIKACHMVMQETDHQLFTESVCRELELGFKKDETSKNRAKEMLSRFGLEEFVDCHPQALSSGQKQRLTIAAAMVRRPDIIILDEPTSGLDGESMARIGNILHDMAEQGHIIIVATHDYEFIAHACSRVVRIEDGIICQDAPVDRMTDDLKYFFFNNEVMEENV